MNIKNEICILWPTIFETDMNSCLWLWCRLHIVLDYLLCLWIGFFFTILVQFCVEGECFVWCCNDFSFSFKEEVGWYVGWIDKSFVYLKKPGSLNQQDSSHNTYTSKIMNKQKYFGLRSHSALTIIHKPSKI